MRNIICVIIQPFGDIISSFHLLKIRQNSLIIEAMRQSTKISHMFISRIQEIQLFSMKARISVTQISSHMENPSGLEYSVDFFERG